MFDALLGRAWVLTWALRLYPPLFFQRIWVKKIAPDFQSLEVRIAKSIWNRNYNASIFGGTIYSGADPFYCVLYSRALAKAHISVVAWVKSASIDYIKPGRNALNLQFNLSSEDLTAAKISLRTTGKFVRSHAISILDAQKKCCASVKMVVYLKLIGS